MNAQRVFFESLAAEWDAHQSPQRETRLRDLVSLFDSVLCHARNLLDVGTGTGALLPLLWEHAPAARLTAVDLAQAMLVRAQNRDASTSFVQADVHALPFHAASFDAVICHGSFPHFCDKRAALLELKRTLRGGGHLILLHDVSRARVNAIHQGAQSAVIHHDLLPSGEEMWALLSAVGFVEIRVEDAADHYFAIANVVSPASNDFGGQSGVGSRSRAQAGVRSFADARTRNARDCGRHSSVNGRCHFS